MGMPSYQTLFDKALKGVVAQGCKSGEAFACWYINVDGDGNEIRCAIGHLVSKDDATNFEAKAKNENIHGLIRSEMFKIPQWMIEKRAFLSDLQYAHDNADAGLDFIYQFKDNMRMVAEKYHLKMEI